MAEEKKLSFPTIPAANWFALREKFKQRLPGEINPLYLASTLSMTETSAGANVLPALKTLGIVGDDGKPTDLAYDWRDDVKYKEVCNKIIQAVYPQALQDSFHDPNTSLDNLKAWFMRSAKVGESAALKYARTYLMLLRADIEDVKETSLSASVNTKVKPEVKKQLEKKQTNKVEVTPTAIPNMPITSSFAPSLHIDIQIHIAPDSSAEQIDKIFESMSKHLKGFKS